MAQLAVKPAQRAEQNIMRVPAGTDLTEWYFEQGWTDGLPVVPPTRALVEAFVDALGGDSHFVECEVPPRHGNLTREVLAINMVMAGCRPAYAPVVRAAILALTAKAFNLNGVQATTHMAAPLLVVNGPVAREIGMNGDCNAFGSGNRANCDDRARLATRAAQCRRCLARRSRQEHTRTPGQIHLLRRRERSGEPMGALSRGKGLRPGRLHSLRAGRRAAAQRHQPCRERPGRHPRQHLLGDEHDRQQQCGVERPLRRRDRAGACPHDRRQRLDPARCAQLSAMHAYNFFSEISFDQRYGKIYNRNLPKWYKREPDARIPIVPSPDHIHLLSSAA